MPKHPSTTYRIYDYISAFCRGQQNAVSGKDLAAMYFPDQSTENGERAVRTAIKAIRRSDVFDNVISSCNKGYYWATKEERATANQRLFNQAFSLLKTAYAQEKKAAEDGQELLLLTPYQRQAVESLCEVRK